ncbi:MAG TPA: CPBP family intramembrane glutamic endopeptidase, partial [Vulgatibacter sp.]
MPAAAPFASSSGLTRTVPRGDLCVALLPYPSDNELVATRPAYAFLLALLAIHLTLGSFVQVANPSFGIAFDELFVFAGLTLLTVRAMNFRPTAFLAIRPPVTALAWPPTVLAAAACFFAAGGLNALNRLLVGPEFADRFDPSRLCEVRSPGEAVLLAFGVTILAPIGEELLFRGYLMRVLGARYGAIGAVFATAALFALVHLNPASVIALFALGVVFGFLRIWSGSIFPSMLAHAIQNGASTVLLFSGLAQQSPDELPAGDAALLFLVSAPIVVAALALLRRVRRSHARAELA